MERELIGGECAYWACIPSKTLLRAPEARAAAVRVAGLGTPTLDWPRLRDYRDYMVHLDDAAQVRGYEQAGADVSRFQVGDEVFGIATWTNNPPGHGDKSMTPYIQMSPSAHAAACSAPLLIIEHEADLRCPATQGDILYNELQLAEKKTEMLRLPGVPHVPSLPTRIARAQALLDWMNRHAR